MEPLLEINHIYKKYGQHTALNNVSMTVPKGSIFGLLGPNGAGKTSLIRIINQITMPDAGTVKLGGEILQPKHIQHIGYMPEERGLYKNMTIEAQLSYLGQLKGMSRQEVQKQIQYWLDKWDINHWRKKKVQELSKGMAQKIQFIATVLHQPQLLILDEPFSGFDPVNANLLKNEILALKNSGTTILFSTHRMESVEEMCDELALIHQSNKILDGTVANIRNQFKQNQFAVAVQLPLEKSTLLKQKWDVDHEKYAEGLFHFEIKNTFESSNQLLKDLMNWGEVVYFSEKIPTINEIFIEKVSQK